MFVESSAVNRRTDNTMAKGKKRQKDKQWSTKHYKEYWRSSNTNSVVMPVEIQNKKSLNYYQKLQYNGKKK